MKTVLQHSGRFTSANITPANLILDYVCPPPPQKKNFSHVAKRNTIIQVKNRSTSAQAVIIQPELPAHTHIWQYNDK